jgi:PEP-CTERM motif
MKITLCAAAIGVAMLTGYGLSAPPAQAGYVVTLTQQGSDVVATGSGPIDLSGLTFSSGGFTFAEMTPSVADITTGPILVFTATDTYTGVSGPLNFGGGSPTDASSGNGDSVSIFGGINELVVPRGYLSDSALSDTATYTGQTFSTLGATPGKYEWTWGKGANQNFTLEIGTAVPEPATWAMMALGFGLLGFLGCRKTRSGNALA